MGGRKKEGEREGRSEREREEEREGGEDSSQHLEESAALVDGITERRVFLLKPGKPDLIAATRLFGR